MKMHRKLVAVLLILMTGSAFAQKISIGRTEGWRCDSGLIKGSRSPDASPEDNVQCKVLGRIFCIVETHRSNDQPEEIAVSRTSDWLNRVGQTGSHMSGKFKPAIATAAAYVYSRPRVPPWSQYYYAVYTCGLEQRVTEPAARHRIAPIWERAAAECQQKYPGEGDGYGNEPLRRCLRESMNATVMRANAHSPSTARSAP
jgi:hypothetical protein